MGCNHQPNAILPEASRVASAWGSRWLDDLTSPAAQEVSTAMKICELDDPLALRLFRCCFSLFIKTPKWGGTVVTQMCKINHL